MSDNVAIPIGGMTLAAVGSILRKIGSEFKQMEKTVTALEAQRVELENRMTALATYAGVAVANPQLKKKTVLGET